MPTEQTGQPSADEQRYVLLASAIAGRSTGIALSRETYAWTNGRVVFLPEGDGGLSMLVHLVVQSALIAAESLQPRIIAKLIGRRQQAARYMTLEAARALRALAACIPPAVEHAVRSIDGVAVTASPEDSLKRASVDFSIPQLPELLGVLRPSKLLSEGGAAMALSALKPARGEESAEELDIPDADDDEDTDESTILKWMSGSGADNFFSRILREQILNVGRGPRTDSSEGGSHVAVGGRSAVKSVGPQAQMAIRPPGLAVLEAFEQARKAWYPEWDQERERYRPDWTAVCEMDPEINPDTEQLRESPDTELQRSLARLGLGFQTHSRRHDGELLDLRALIDLAVARVAGENGDERVYQTRLKTAHQLGVVVLLDASGSTDEASEKKRTVWDAQRRLAANLIRGLEEVGDRVAAYGFRSYNRQDVRFLRIKEFHSRFDGGARTRLSALEPSGFTRMGAAIRHAVHVARTYAGTPQMLLVLISDGLPYEDGYDGHYARDDTRKALEEAVANGVGCVCLSVGATTGGEELRQLWGDASYMCIDDPLALGSAAEPLFRTALRAALESSHGSSGTRTKRPSTRAAESRQKTRMLRR